MECYGFDTDVRYHMSWRTIEKNLPRIGAQREDYLVKALSGYKTGERHGYDPAMVEVAQAMSEAEIADVAHYLAHWH